MVDAEMVDGHLNSSTPLKLLSQPIVDQPVVHESIVEENVQEPIVPQTNDPSPNASSPLLQPHSKFTFQPSKCRRYAGDTPVPAQLAVPPVGPALPQQPVRPVKVEDEKPTVKWLNPVACRQPLHKSLKVDKRYVDQEEKNELRAKLCETENELLLAKIATERHKLHAAQLQLQFAQDEHKLKMEILREDLSFAKFRCIDSLIVFFCQFAVVFFQWFLYLTFS